MLLLDVASGQAEGR